ncbi:MULTISPECIES: DUF397 domain-containing protein [Actinomadura]|uniref:DUF397 domain-containing protein n=1 Tax=Actinomadura yumaensis TaxID=111807 RepID=A0ABW2CE93_9ACTN|nr:DUF397 domain-containing protein [Actinomadura sp. J1-007]MWK35739.1 DUF397 domain-containing protein [Actinomadura sp. J1-007]
MRNEDLSDVSWRKSRRSEGPNACVEVGGVSAGRIAVRDSRDPGGPRLALTGDAWDVFVREVKDGAYDLRRAGPLSGRAHPDVYGP